MEHERKFLVANDDWRQQVMRSQRIQQAYLADMESGVIRARLIDTVGWISLKCRIDATTSREFEYPIPAADAVEILELPGTIGRVYKTRHILDNDWIVDEFEGALAGLVVAEIEMDHANSVIEIPQWAAAEVTTDYRYRNRQLAVSGLPVAADS